MGRVDFSLVCDYMAGSDILGSWSSLHSNSLAYEVTLLKLRKATWKPDSALFSVINHRPRCTLWGWRDGERRLVPALKPQECKAVAPLTSRFNSFIQPLKTLAGSWRRTLTATGVTIRPSWVQLLAEYLWLVEQITKALGLAC